MQEHKFYSHGQQSVRYAHVPRFLMLLLHRASQQLCWSFSVFLSVSIFLSVWTPWRLSPLPCPSLSFFLPFISVTGACFFLLTHGGLWLGCLDLPAMGMVYIQELATNSGSSRMSQAPNLHFARQLLIIGMCSILVTDSIDHDDQFVIEQYFNILLHPTTEQNLLNIPHHWYMFFLHV